MTWLNTLADFVRKLAPYLALAVVFSVIKTSYDLASKEGVDFLPREQFVNPILSSSENTRNANFDRLRTVGPSDRGVHNAVKRILTKQQDRWATNFIDLKLPVFSDFHSNSLLNNYYDYWHVLSRNLENSLLLASVLFILLYWRVLMPVRRINQHLSDVRIAEFETAGPLKLSPFMNPEVASTTDKINQIQNEVREQLKMRFRAESKLQDLNRTLEKEIDSRIRENERQRLQIEEKARLSMLGELAGGIAHEINNPLTIVYGYASIIKNLCNASSLDRERLKNVVDKVEANIERINRVISGLMYLSRPPEPFEKGAYDASRVVRDTITITNERFISLGVKVMVDYDAHQVETSCHRRDLAQIVLSLLSNAQYALKDTPQPWIKIGLATTSDRRLKITITDNGSGVPETLRKKIHTPFFTTKAPGEGAGLGLSVARSIAQRYNGDVFLDSKAIFTRFVIDMPLQPA